MKWSCCSPLGPMTFPTPPRSPFCKHSHSLRPISWIWNGLAQHQTQATKVSSTWSPKLDTELENYVRNLCLREHTEQRSHFFLGFVINITNEGQESQYIWEICDTFWDVSIAQKKKVFKTCDFPTSKSWVFYSFSPSMGFD